MSFRDIVGLPIDSFEKELHFNRDLIHYEGIKEYSLSDLSTTFKESVDKKYLDLVKIKQYQDIYRIREKSFWENTIFDIFIILPGFYGGEFTHIPGYYRNIADNGFHYSELWQVAEGYAEFLLQQPTEKHEQVKDCILYRCQTRDIAIIPPSHGVTILNPSNKKAVIVRLRARDAKSIMAPYTKTRGACYYREKNDRWAYNDNYEEIPAMRLLPSPHMWKIVQRGEPLYSTYIMNPSLAHPLNEPNPADYASML